MTVMNGRRKESFLAKSLYVSSKLCLVVIQIVVDRGARSGYSIPVCSEGRPDMICAQWNPIRHGDVVCKLDNIFDLWISCQYTPTSRDGAKSYLPTIQADLGEVAYLIFGNFRSYLSGKVSEDGLSSR